MSELIGCDYCYLKSVRRDKPKGSRVYLRREIGGISVYVVPKGERLDKTDPGDDGGKHWITWLMKLTDHCVCRRISEKNK